MKTKLKTVKAIAKRFKLTRKGKIKRTKASTGHLLSHKNRKRKRSLKRPALVSAGEKASIRKMLPYGS